MSLTASLQRHRDLALLAGAIALLTVIPDTPVGPLQVINPQRIWLIVTLLLGINTLGALASRLLGTRHGLPVAGFISGFVSSTATISALGLKVRKTPALHAPAVAAAVLSSVATFIQMALLLAALSLPLFYELLLPLTLGSVASALYSIFFIRRTLADEQSLLPAAGNIISLKAALLLAGLITLTTVAVALLHHFLGAAGMWLGAGVAGLTDAHAAAASVASLVEGKALLPAAAVIPVMIGLSANTLMKAIFSASLGSRTYAAEVIPGLALGLLAAWLGTLPTLLGN